MISKYNIDIWKLFKINNDDLDDIKSIKKNNEK